MRDIQPGKDVLGADQTHGLRKRHASWRDGLGFSRQASCLVKAQHDARRSALGVAALLQEPFSDARGSVERLLVGSLS